MFARLPETCTVIQERVDAGCLQNGFIQMDVPRSFLGLADFYSNRVERLAKETQWLQENDIDLVLCDISSLPLKVGRALGLPALLLANFTWHDIYAAFPNAGAHAHLLNYLKEEYAAASLQILPQCFISNSIPMNKEEVGFISIKGSDIREHLERILGVRLSGKTVVFVYLGLADASEVQWHHLASIKDCIFLTRDPLPAHCLPDNFAVLDEGCAFPDLIASSDVVLTKAGYSTLATAFTHNKPVLSCSRENFSEFEVMRQFMEQQEVGMIIPEKEFYSCRWGDYIRRATILQVTKKVRLNGAEDVVRIVDRCLKR